MVRLSAALLLFSLVACVPQPTNTDGSFTKQQAATVATIVRTVDDTRITVSTLAQAAQAACGNTEPGGPCLPGRPMTTELEAQAKAGFLLILALCDQIDVAMNEGRTAIAATKLAEVQDKLGETKASLAKAGVK